MQAIITSYHDATNTRPRKMSAKCTRGSIRIIYANALDIEENHIAAAKALVALFVKEDAENEVKRYATPPDQNPWNRPFLSGCLPSGDFAHVFTPKGAK